MKATTKTLTNYLIGSFISSEGANFTILKGYPLFHFPVLSPPVFSFLSCTARHITASFALTLSISYFYFQAHHPQATLCVNCLVYIYYNPLPKDLKVARWPSSVAEHILNGSNYVWEALPPSVRSTWFQAFSRGVSAPVTVLDGMLKLPPVTSLQEFESQANAEWDTKCARCRTLLVSGDHDHWPLYDFKQTSWMGRPFKSSVDVSYPYLAPLWESPTLTYTGEAFTRVFLYKGVLHAAVCPECYRSIWKIPFLSPVWQKDLQHKSVNSVSVPNNRDMHWMNPIHLADRIISGTRLCQRNDGPDNVKFHRLDMGSQACVQMVTGGSKWLHWTRTPLRP